MLTRRENLKLLLAASVFSKAASQAAPTDAGCPSCSSGTTLEMGDILDAAPSLGLGSLPPHFVETSTSGRNGAPIHYVNSATGQLAFHINDIAVDSTPKILLNRHYHSGNQSDSGLGAGWSLEFDDVIEVTGASAILRSAAGDTVEMRLDSSGSTYQPVSPGLTAHGAVHVMGDGTLREDVASYGARVYSKINGSCHLTALDYGE